MSGQASVNWTHHDPPGVSEPGVAYDPLGNMVAPAPPQRNQGPSTGTYRPSYLGPSSSFSNANNYSTGCVVDGKPTDRNRALQLLNDGSVRPDRNTGLPDTQGLRDAPMTRPGPFGQYPSRAEGVPGDYFYNGRRDEGPQAPTTFTAGASSGATPQGQSCKDVAKLEAADTDKGALARLIFAEATGYETMSKELYKAAGVNPDESPTNIDMGTSYFAERYAVAASVYNRVLYLSTISTRRDPPRLGSPNASILDVIYSRGDVAGTQYQGFTTKNGALTISGGIQKKINGALSSAVDSTICYDLLNAIYIAHQPYKDPFGPGTTFGLFSGRGSQGSNFYSLSSIPGSGNTFYGLRH